MVLNATFNNILAISWWSVLLVEETRENQRLVESNWQTLSHHVVSRTLHYEQDSNSQLLWGYALIEQVIVNPTTIRSLPRRPVINYKGNNKITELRILYYILYIYYITCVQDTKCTFLYLTCSGVLNTRCT